MVKDSVFTIKPETLLIKDGEDEIYGKLYAPEKEGVYPAVIVSHGFNGTHTDFAVECQLFAEHGFIVYAYDFCGGSTRSQSRGKTSTEMTIYTEMANLLAVVKKVKSLETVDPSRIFLLGASQGGLVTALVAERIKDEIAGIVLYYPALNIPDDWRSRFAAEADIPETYEPFHWGLLLGKIFFTSIRDLYPFEIIGGFEKEVLLIYGDADPIVPRSYLDKAAKIYQNVKQIVLAGEGHGFSSSGAIAARESVLDFLEAHTGK